MNRALASTNPRILSLRRHSIATQDNLGTQKSSEIGMMLFQLQKAYIRALQGQYAQLGQSPSSRISRIGVRTSALVTAFVVLPSLKQRRSKSTLGASPRSP